MKSVSYKLCYIELLFSSPRFCPRENETDHHFSKGAIAISSWTHLTIEDSKPLNKAPELLHPGTVQYCALLPNIVTQFLLRVIRKYISIRLFFLKYCLVSVPVCVSRCQYDSSVLYSLLTWVCLRYIGFSHTLLEYVSDYIDINMPFPQGSSKENNRLDHAIGKNLKLPSMLFAPCFIYKRKAWQLKLGRESAVDCMILNCATKKLITWKRT